MKVIVIDSNTGGNPENKSEDESNVVKLINKRTNDVHHYITSYLYYCRPYFAIVLGLFSFFL